ERRNEDDPSLHAGNGVVQGDVCATDCRAERDERRVRDRRRAAQERCGGPRSGVGVCVGEVRGRREQGDEEEEPEGHSPAAVESAIAAEPKAPLGCARRSCYEGATMGATEMAALTATAFLCLYARRRLPKGEWTWSILGYGYARPMTVWGIVYVLSFL